MLEYYNIVYSPIHFIPDDQMLFNLLTIKVNWIPHPMQAVPYGMR